MARQVRHLVEAPRECSYLAAETAQLEHRVLLDVRPEELSHLLERGWRRFGPDYFRPACRACSACLPTRIPTASFKPSKSQRRAARKCASLVTAIGTPTVDDERLQLYAAWHATREAARGWRESGIDEESYRFQFAFAHPSAREITFRDPETGELVGVALADEAPDAWSAIYFFYAPSWAKQSIGVANVLFQIEAARTRSIAHLYLGYCVLGCASLAYKASFQPQERLVGWPGLDEAPTWALVAPAREDGED